MPAAALPVTHRLSAPTSFLGSRFLARQLREQLEELLLEADEVVVDFTGAIGATQSFIDELLGVLVLHRGPEVIHRLVFHGCTDDLRKIIRFVISARRKDFQEQNQH